MRLLHLNPDRMARLLYPQTMWFLIGVMFFLFVLSFLVRVRATLGLDLRATKLLQEWNHPAASAFAKWLTFMANSLTLCILAAAVAIICLIAGEWRAGLFVVASLLSLPINLGLKNIFDRERPGETEAKIMPGPRWGYSYPSGHAMGAASFYGMVATFVYLHVPDVALRYALLVPICMLPPLIAASRVYLGAHWFSDVVGGLAAGMMLVVILAVVYPI